jgi:hypothetical protein
MSALYYLEYGTKYFLEIKNLVIGYWDFSLSITKPLMFLQQNKKIGIFG